MAETIGGEPRSDAASGADAWTYDVFISYRHGGEDQATAERLHRLLEGFRTPAGLVARGSPPRLKRVFRDRDELPTSSDLSESIKAALETSRYLVVVCSPRAKASMWIAKEIEIFRALGRGRNILTLLIEGTPEEAFPPGLVERRLLTVTDAATGETRQVEQVAEPLAADIRAPTAGERRRRLKVEILRVLAPVLGCTFDDLRQRQQERARRRVAWAGAAMAAATTAFASLAGFAFVQRSEALVQRQQAEERRIEAQTQRAAADEQRNAAQAQRAEAERRRAQAEAAQREQARTLARAAHQELDKGQVESGRALALRALLQDGGLVADPVAEGRLALMRADHLDRLIGRTKTPEGAPVAFALAGGGRFLVVGTNARQALIYDVAERRLLHRLPTHNDVATSLDVSPDGERVLVAGDHRPRVWTIATGALEFELPRPAEKGYVHTARFGPDGRTLATGANDNHVKIWDGRTGRLLATVAGADPATTPKPKSESVTDPIMSAVKGATWNIFGSVHELRANPNGRLLAAFGQGDPLRAATIVEAATGRKLSVLPVPGENELSSVTEAAFSPDSRMVAAARMNEVAVFESVSGRRLWGVRQPGTVEALVFDPSGRYLATGGSDRAVRIWNAATGASVTEVLGERAQVERIAFSPDGRTLAIGYATGAVGLVETGRWAGRAVIKAHGAGVSALAFTPDGSQLISGGRDGGIAVWRAEPPPAQDFAMVKRDHLIAPDGGTLFAARGSLVEIWALGTERRASTLAFAGPVLKMLPALDGRHFAVEHGERFGARTLAIVDWRGRRVADLPLEKDAGIETVSIDGGEALAALSDGKTTWLMPLAGEAAARKTPGAMAGLSPDGKTVMLLRPDGPAPTDKTRLTLLRAEDLSGVAAFPAVCPRAFVDPATLLAEGVGGSALIDLATGRRKAALEGALPRLAEKAGLVATVSRAALLLHDPVRRTVVARRALPIDLGEVTHLEIADDGQRALVMGTQRAVLMRPETGEVLAAWPAPGGYLGWSGSDACTPGGSYSAPTQMVPPRQFLARDGRHALGLEPVEAQTPEGESPREAAYRLQLRDGATGAPLATLSRPVEETSLARAALVNARMILRPLADNLAAIVAAEPGPERTLHWLRRADAFGSSESEDEVDRERVVLTPGGMIVGRFDERLTLWDADGRLAGVRIGQLAAATAPPRFHASPFASAPITDDAPAPEDEVGRGDWTVAPDGTRLVGDRKLFDTADGDRFGDPDLHLIDVTTRAPIAPLSSSEFKAEPGGRFSRDGSVFVARIEPRTGERFELPTGLGVWDGRSGAELGRIIDPEQRSPRYLLSPDGRFIVTLASGRPRLFDREIGYKERALPAAVTSAITAMAFSQDGRFLLVGAADGYAGGVELAKGALAFVVQGRGLPIRALAHPPGRNELLTADDSGTVTLFEAGLRLPAWEAFLAMPVAGLVPAPDGSVLAYSGSGEIVRLSPDRRWNDPNALPALVEAQRQRSGDTTAELSRPPLLIESIRPPSRP